MNIVKGAAIITCNPAIVMAVVAVASAAAGGYATYQSGQTQKKAAEYNEKMGEYKALDAAQRGAAEGAAKRDRARKIASQQAEGMAAGGVDISSGTPLALLTETAGLGELDALTSVNNARREAWGYQAQGTLDRYQGKMAGRGGTLNAGGTLLGGASNAYFGYKAAA
jgi:hypothetical protein